MKLIRKILYTMKMGIAYRQRLAMYPSGADTSVDQVVDLTINYLNAEDIQVLILDFDGVLAAHHANQPIPAVEAWLSRLIATWSPRPIAILSNRPTLAREHYLKIHFPEVRLLPLIRSKPYPDGLQAVIQEFKCLPQQVLMVDDRLLTGILSAEIAGTKALYIRRPYRQWRTHFFVEIFFAVLRFLERKLLTLFKK